MELTFANINGKYVAELRAATPFNLHIEGGGSMSLLRRTSGESYKRMAYLPCDVFDQDVNVVTEADFIIEIHDRPSMVVVTLADGTRLDGVIPEEPSEPDAPEGYTVFMASDGPFMASDGAFYCLI